MCSKVHIASSYSLASMYNSSSHFPIISTFILIPLILIPIPLSNTTLSHSHTTHSSSFQHQSHPHSHTIHPHSNTTLPHSHSYCLPSVLCNKMECVIVCIRHSVSATGQVRVSQSALLRQPCGDNIQVYESPHNVLVGCPL